MTAAELQLKINKFNDLITEFGVSNFNSKVLWQLRNELSEYFRAVTFTDNEEKQTMLLSFNSLIDLLKEKQDKITVEHEAFANDAVTSIAELKAFVGDGFFINNPEREAITELKSLIEKAFDYFKQPQWPSKEKRAEAWTEFSELREKLKKEEDEYYTILREKKNERNNRSLQLTEKLIDMVNAIHPDTDVTIFYDTLNVTLEFLRANELDAAEMEKIKTGRDINNKLNLKPKSEALRAVRKILNDYRDDLTREDKHQLFTVLDSINEDLNKAWDIYREELKKKQEEWEERKKQHEFKQQEWQVKQKDFLQTLTEKAEKRLSDKANLERILTSKKDFLGRQRSRLDNQQLFVKKISEDLADMEEKLTTAWSEEFKERMTEKVEQKKAKIAEVKTDITEVVAKVEEVEKDIKEIAEKIELIAKSHEEMQKKIEEVKANLEK